MSAHERVFRVLLRVLPREFRERYGDAMTAFHRDRVRALRLQRRSPFSAWLVIVADLMTTAVAEHSRARRARRLARIHQSRKDSPMSAFIQDAKFAARSLLRRPAFATVVIGTIALGVGANAAIFSVVNAILLRPLPYANPDRVISFGHEPPHWLTSDPNFLDYKSGVTSLENLAAYTQALATVSATTAGGEPVRVRAVRVSDDFFATLGTPPLRGRFFSPDEFAGMQSTVVMLSHGYWKRAFGGDTSVLNKTLILNGVRRTIVGVMPPHFNYPEARSDVWVPMPRITSAGDRSNNYLFLVGRMKAGVSVERLRSEASTVAGRIMADNPGRFDPRQPLQPHIEQVSDQLVKHARPYLYALLGTVAFVLLIACANVANLMLARAEGRRREVAVRSALGASGRRLVGQLFTEGALISLIGGVAGLVIGIGLTRLIVIAAPGAVPRLDEVSIDWRVVLFTLGAAATTGLFISIVPALRSMRDPSFLALKSATKAPLAGSARNARHALVVAEVALAVVALTGAGMLLRSLWNLQSADLGFDARSVLTARVSLAQREYDTGRTAQFYHDLLERVRAIPGVAHAGAAGWLPVVDAGGLWGIIPEGRVYGPASGSSANQPSIVPQQVTPGYFAAARIPVMRGRDFTDADREGAEHVAIISQTMANEVWPGEEPLGKRFRIGGDTTLPLMAVVGVVGDIRSRGFSDTPEPTMYVPHAQSGRTSFFMPRAMALVVRTSGDPMSVAGAVAAAVHALDRNAPVSEVRSMEAVVGTSVATREFSTSLLAAFAVLALLLAGVGTYGVIAYGVAQRTYEIGVRMALGAEQRTVLRLVMREGLWMCAIGLAIGLAGAVIAARWVRSLLVDVPAIDVASLLTTSALLLIVGALASLLPARRASDVSPTEALRGS